MYQNTQRLGLLAAFILAIVPGVASAPAKADNLDYLRKTHPEAQVHYYRNTSQPKSTREPVRFVTTEFGQGTRTQVTILDQGTVFDLRDGKGNSVGTATLFHSVFHMPQMEPIYKSIVHHPYKTLFMTMSGPDPATISVRMTEDTDTKEFGTWLYIQDPQDGTCILFDGSAKPKYAPAMKRIREGAIAFLKMSFASEPEPVPSPASPSVASEKTESAR